MNITTERAQALVNAMSEGQQWAANLAVGDVFRGSHGEGRHVYPNDPQLADFFGTGAYATLKRLDLWVGDAGTITHIGDKARFGVEA